MTMSKVFSFMAGAISGALVGGVLVVLFTPASGEELKQGAVDRWNLALEEARNARDQKRIELETQFREASSA
jgi:gas vesicle protein